MTTVRDELKIIPRGWWVFVAVFAVAVTVLAFGLATGALLHAPSSIPAPKLLLLAPALLLAAVFLAAWLTLIAYIWADAKRRRMRHVLWTLIAFFVPNALGIVLYFVLRSPAPPTCSACGVDGRAGFSYCANCGAPLAPTCPKCNTPVESGWNVCPHCGIRLGEAAPKV